MKRISAAVAAFILVLSTVAFVACKPAGEHVHDYGDWEVVTEETCTEDGLMRRYCKAGDNAYESEVIPALGHSFGTNNVCVRCGHEIIPTEGLGYMPEEGGYSVVCGSATAMEIVIPAYYEGKPVLSVHADGFMNKSITSLFLPEGIKSIGKRAFYDCVSLTSIVLPNSLEEISDMAFANCFAVNTATIGTGRSNLITIGKEAFRDNNSLVSIVIPESVKTVGDFAYSNCGLARVIRMGNGVETIGVSAFSNCVSISSVTLSMSVKSIGANAFAGCKEMKEIVFYPGVTAIGSGAFNDCENLATLRYWGSMADWQSRAASFAFDWNGANSGDFRIRCTDGDLDRSGFEIH